MHANAFGVSIPEKDIPSFIEKTNKMYADVPQEPVYWVDYIWTKNEVDPKTILEIAEHREIWGQEIPESYVCIKDINLSTCHVQGLSLQKHPTIKVSLDNGVDIMKFKSSIEELEEFTAPNKILTAVCRCNKNEWNGRVTPQLIIEDFKLDTRWIF